MPSPLLGSLAKTVNKALGATLFDLSYRQLATYQVRASAGAVAGASSIAFTNLPSGLTGVLAGDTFKIGSTVHTIAADVPAAAGSISGIAFAPNLAQAVNAASVIELKRTAAVTCKGFDEQIDTTRQTSSHIQQGDWKIMILAESLSVTPKMGDQVTTRDGRVVTVKNVGSDPAKATWTLQAS